MCSLLRRVAGLDRNLRRIRIAMKKSRKRMINWSRRRKCCSVCEVLRRLNLSGRCVIGNMRLVFEEHHWSDSDVTILHQQFLDVPEATSLKEHLSALSIKYSLSNFEALACQFFQAIDSMLGQPSLVSVSLSLLLIRLMLMSFTRHIPAHSLSSRGATLYRIRKVCHLS